MASTCIYNLYCTGKIMHYFKNQVSLKPKEVVYMLKNSNKSWWLTSKISWQIYKILDPRRILISVSVNIQNSGWQIS